jgi:hypothetical protein
MILVKATSESEAGTLPDEALAAQMASYHEELAKAGALIDASGLQPTSRGWRIRYSTEDGKSGKRVVTDGPFTETKELLAGYTIIRARTREEAREWTKRFPNPAGTGVACEIEVRQLFELEDFGESPAMARFRTLDDQRMKARVSPDRF